jgi:pyruvate/2-oxoglutarate/acetoin dehydrogenase E1 component
VVPDSRIIYFVWMKGVPMSEPIVVKVQIVDVYGKPTYYPTNHIAEMLSHIAGTKTLTPQTLKLAHDMGMVVEAERKIDPLEVILHGQK